MKHFIILFTWIPSLIQGLVEDECGTTQCLEADTISQDRKKNCKQYPFLDICTQTPVQIARRFPGVLHTTPSLNKMCRPQCLHGDLRLAINPDDKSCIPKGCDHLERYGERLVHEFPPGQQHTRNQSKQKNRQKKRKKDRKKRQVTEDMIDESLRFEKLFKWEDVGGQKCCKTWRKTMPIQWPIAYGRNQKYKAHPIFCPLSGGYQWVDLVRCEKAKCNTECVKSFTHRAFLVTNIVPHPYWGHCLHSWVAAWFLRTPVDTHCFCADDLSHLDV